MAVIDILIADYQTSVAQELKVRVEGLGYRVVDLAHSSEEALSKIEALHPHLILMNIRLKGRTEMVRGPSMFNRTDLYTRHQCTEHHRG